MKHETDHLIQLSAAAEAGLDITKIMASNEGKAIMDFFAYQRGLQYAGQEMLKASARGVAVEQVKWDFFRESTSTIVRGYYEQVNRITKASSEWKEFYDLLSRLRSHGSLIFKANFQN